MPPTFKALDAALQSPLVGLETLSNLETKIPSLSQKQTPECLKQYTDFLRSKYRTLPLKPPGEWPRIRGRVYSDLTIVEKVIDFLPNEAGVEEKIKALSQGQVKVSEKEKIIKSLDDVFGESDASAKPLKVLIEGIPGVGKSTLVRKSYKDWIDGKSLQQFQLVILATLRKQEIRMAKSVEDLLEADDPDLNNQLAKYLQKTSGEGVLFIFDGYDELNEDEQQFFLKFIQKEELHKCSVVLTSRSYAVEDLKCEEWIHHYVEILGFTKLQMENYFLQNNANLLVQSLKEERSLSSISYTPLNCSILLYIFQVENQKLPTTLTELFSAFIVSLLRCHAEKTNDKKLVKCMKNVHQKPWMHCLPQPQMHQFSTLCKLAYHGLIRGKFIFTANDIFEDLYEERLEVSLLSLMTSTTKFSRYGEETHYQFLHATIQEYLAANWVTDQPSGLLEEFLSYKSVMSLRMKTVLCFVAGISRLKKNEVNLKRFLNNANLDLLWGVPIYKSNDLDTDIEAAFTEPAIIMSRVTYMQRDSCGRKILTHVDEQQKKQLEQRNSTWLQAFRGIVKDSQFHRKAKHHLVNPTQVPIATRILINISSMLCEAKSAPLYELMHDMVPFHSTRPSTKLSLGYIKLSTADSVALAKLFSICQLPFNSLCFDFCKVSHESLKIFSQNSQESCTWHYNEVQLNFCSPCFSLGLSLIPQIPWLQHTKILCLHGLKYPRSGELQLHTLLQLKELTDLTLTIEGIPEDCLSNYIQLFSETLKNNTTLCSLTYHQTPPAPCTSFAHLMKALSHNTRVSLTLGSTKVITKDSVTIPDDFCFKICCSGLASVMQLINARGKIKLHTDNCSHNLFSPCCCLEKNQAVTLSSCSVYTSGYEHLEVFKDTFQASANAKEFRTKYCTPGLSSMLFVFHQIPWFHHVRVLCLHGLQYPDDLIDPEAFQLHSLLKLQILTHLTVTVENIDKKNLLNFETVFVKFTDNLCQNNTLQSLTYDQSPSAATCKSFTQLMLALTHNTRVSLMVVSERSNKPLINSQYMVSILRDTCFKICHQGMLAAMKLIEERGIKKLKLDNLDIFSYCKACNNIMPLEPERSISIAIASNKTLQLLDISGWQVTNEIAQCIASGLAKNETINQLSINVHSLQSLIISLIQNKASNLKKVHVINTNVDLKLSYIPILTCCLDKSDSTDESNSVEQIFESLIDVPGVQKLVINDTSLAQSGIVKKTLEKLLKSNHWQTLQSFHFGNNETLLASPRKVNRKTAAVLIILPSSGDQMCYYHSAVDAVYILESFQTNYLEEFNLTLPDDLYDVPLQQASGAIEALCSTISNFLSKQRRLKSLHLRWCRLEDIHATCISTELYKNLPLKNLDLSHNYITAYGAKELFQLLMHNNTTLEHLDLSHNRLIQQVTEHKMDLVMGQMLQVNTSLRSLSLSSCTLDAQRAISIATGLAKNHSLEILNLDGNHIQSIGAKHIFEALCLHSTLRELDLSNNEFEMSYRQEADFGDALRAMLTSCQTLTKLGLSSCGIAFAVYIATGLAKNHSLEILNLDGNHIQSIDAKYIFGALCLHSALRELDLSNNEFEMSLKQEADFGDALRAMLTSCQTLKELCHYLSSLVTAGIITLLLELL